MAYDFSSLLPADFEDLARDLVGKALGVRFEAFGPGPDDGIDGRHASGHGDVILQAKHYGGSSFSQLKTAMRKERKAIDRLAPDRYVLATARHLTPASKAKLAQEIGPALHQSSDIFGRADLNGLLREYPGVEKAHLKLWLSSTGVLETILEAIVHAGSHAFTASSKSQIAQRVKVYAPNPSLGLAREILDERHVLIISGPPGVGKTTLAEILTFAYLREGWDLVALRSLEDGFERINDAAQQIFFFDDFLGAIALDQRALAAKDSELARFMQHVKASPNARFILTTRAYILNEARQWSERLADRRVELSTYMLDLSSYTRAIRARILYNHLAIGEVPQAHVLALIDSGELPAIIDHDNYNPRIVQWMTEEIGIEGLAPADYPQAFIDLLDNPAKLWDKAFTKHITPAARHLLIALFFADRGSSEIADLRTLFEPVHGAFCSDLGLARDPKDFEQSLRQLENGFVAIEEGEVDFINPSVRDYLKGYLTDDILLKTVASACRTARSALQVWTFAKSQLDWLALPELAHYFLPALDSIAQEPASETRGLDNSDLIELLLEWWAHSDEAAFSDAARAVLRDPPRSLVSWRDGTKILELMAQLSDAGHFEQGETSRELAELLEVVAIALFEEGMSSDELQAMSDTIETGRSYSAAIVAASHAAIVREIDEASETLSHLTSESELEEHAEILRALAPRARIPDFALERALDAVEERIGEVQVRQAKASDPAIPASDEASGDHFDDEAIRSLFDSLR